MQYSILGDKCIYDNNIIINDSDIKLHCKFVIFG
jgi:hypothetical protein